MDRFDAIAIGGCLALVGLSAVADRLLVAAAFGGFALSLSSWRLYHGRPWEALAWLAWVGTATTLVLAPGGVAFVLAFFGTMFVGLGLLFGARLELLPNVWKTG